MRFFNTIVIVKVLGQTIWPNILVRRAEPSTIIYNNDGGLTTLNMLKLWSEFSRLRLKRRKKVKNNKIESYQKLKNNKIESIKKHQKVDFINRLPATITRNEIAQIFRTHGAIGNIVIPTTQKNPTHRFAFVQYLYPQSLHTAIRDENGKEINGSRITVYLAKYDTTTISNHQIRD